MGSYFRLFKRFSPADFLVFAKTCVVRRATWFSQLGTKRTGKTNLVNS